jgi:hypothetical protein
MGLVISKGLTLRKEFQWNETVWNPSMISTALWLDAADASTVTLESGAVSQWNDKSGNNRHATQVTLEARPTIVSSSVNGRAVIRYDGIDDLLNLPAITASAGITLFFVLRQNKQAVARNGGIALFSSFTGTGSSPHFGGGTGGQRDWFDSFYSAARPQVSSTLIPNGVYVGSIKQTGTAIAGTVFGLITASVSATFNGSPSLCTVGTGITGIFSQNDYAELVLVQSPSASDELKIEGYLAHKWALTANLPSDHPYKTVGPTP